MKKVEIDQLLTRVLIASQNDNCIPLIKMKF